jgi:uncharacterized protein with HEPN domain
MRKYALEITEIIKGVPHAKFVENKIIRYAIERLLLIVGEAAHHVSKEFQETSHRTVSPIGAKG